MQLKTCTIVVWALLGVPCVAGISIETDKQSELTSHLVESAVTLLTSCYGGRVTEVGIHGDHTGNLFKALSLKQALATTLFDNTPAVRHNGSVRKESLHNPQLFAIVVSSTTEFQKTLEKIKNSPWWNHMASFLILNWIPESNHESSNASELLSTAWRMNLLNVNLLCVHRANKVSLYTFNPYTKRAPYPWKLKDPFSRVNGHPWSMFVQEFQDEDNCEGLDFDKTIDLGGYKIPSTVEEVPEFLHLNPNKAGVDMCEGSDGIVLQTIFRAMNANVNLVIHDTEPLIALYDKDNNTALVLDLIKGITDIVLLASYQEPAMNLTTTYPHWSGGLGVITPYSAPASQLSKINSVIDVSSRYGLYLVILTTVIFFKFFVRQTLMSAILNTLRITCNSCLPVEPRTTSARVYLGALFIFQVTILALYQGQLASLLTNEVYKKNVNTMKDLGDSGYTIHGWKELASYFTDPVFEGRFVGHKTVDCEMYVSPDSSTACVEDWDLLLSKEISSNLHMSTDMVIKSYLVFVIREDWPLEQRFNEILGRMTNADIFRLTYTANSEKVLGINKINDQMRTNQGPKVLTFRQLSFAFAILGIGLGCATVTFIVEVIRG